MGGKYWEATVAPVSLSDVGVWETPRSCFISGGGEDMIDPNVLEGYVLVDLTHLRKLCSFDRAYIRPRGPKTLGAGPNDVHRRAKRQKVTTFHIAIVPPNARFYPIAA